MARRGQVLLAVLVLLGGVTAVAALALLGALRLAEVGAPAPPQASGAPLAATDGYALWATRDDGTPARWDPCGEVRWVLRVEGAPDGARALVAEAFDRIGRETGLTFTYAGPTDELPALHRDPYEPARHGEQWAPVLVAWVPPLTGDVPLQASDRAVTVPIAVDGTFVSGQVVLNDRRRLTMDFADRRGSWGATLLHELGHLVGLDHVDDPAELMFRYPGDGAVVLGDGDRRGLAAVGDPTGDAPCLDPGPPRPVVVEVHPRR